MKNDKNVSVLGDGGWGTALAISLAMKSIPVRLWSAFVDYVEILKTKRENIKYLPGFDIPKAITITANLKEAIDAIDIVIIAIPSQFLRGVLNRVKKSGGFGNVRMAVSVVKGIENKTFKRPSQIIQEELGISDLVVMTGPTIAREVAKGMPTSAVAASENEAHAKELQTLFMSKVFRVYTSSDVIGAELGGALKNIIAIAAGISDGLGFGTNAKSALFTRGIVEMKRLGVALGARSETFDGLSGMGDLLTTCVSPYSRNRHVGEEIAKGKPLQTILDNMEMIAEGVETARSVYELAQKMSIDVPITQEVYRVLFEHKDPSAAVTDLMTRTKKPE